VALRRGGATARTRARQQSLALRVMPGLCSGCGLRGGRERMHEENACQFALLLHSGAEEPDGEGSRRCTARARAIPSCLCGL